MPNPFQKNSDVYNQLVRFNVERFCEAAPPDQAALALQCLVDPTITVFDPNRFRHPEVHFEHFAQVSCAALLVQGDQSDGRKAEMPSRVEVCGVASTPGALLLAVELHNDQERKVILDGRSNRIVIASGGDFCGYLIAIPLLAEFPDEDTRGKQVQVQRVPFASPRLMIEESTRFLRDRRGGEFVRNQLDMLIGQLGDVTVKEPLASAQLRDVPGFSALLRLSDHSFAFCDYRPRLSMLWEPQRLTLFPRNALKGLSVLDRISPTRRVRPLTSEIEHRGEQLMQDALEFFDSLEILRECRVRREVSVFPDGNEAIEAVRGTIIMRIGGEFAAEDGRFLIPTPEKVFSCNHRGKLLIELVKGADGEEDLQFAGVSLTPRALKEAIMTLVKTPSESLLSEPIFSAIGDSPGLGVPNYVDCDSIQRIVISPPIDTRSLSFVVAIAHKCGVSIVDVVPERGTNNIYFDDRSIRCVANLPWSGDKRLKRPAKGEPKKRKPKSE